MVTRKGSWYYYGEQRMAQGRDKTLLELAASAPLAECARPFRLRFGSWVPGTYSLSQESRVACAVRRPGHAHGCCLVGALGGSVTCGATKIHVIERQLSIFILHC